MQWAGTPSVYGPLFTAISYLLVPFGIAADVLAHKAVAAASSLILISLVWRAARLRGIDPTKAAALVGLNPVIVLFGVGGGHNDLLMLAILVAGLYVLLQSRELPGGALMVAATAVKLTAGLLLPFAFAAEHGRSEAAGPAGPPARRRPGGDRDPRLSPTSSSAPALCGCRDAPGDPEGRRPAQRRRLRGDRGRSPRAGRTGDTVLSFVFVLALGWLLRRVWIGELDWIAGAGWATVCLLLTTGFLVPWYVAWLIPLAALSGDTRLLGAAIALTGLGMTTL